MFDRDRRDMADISLTSARPSISGLGKNPGSLLRKR
jgi:hypothetical protein